MAYLMLGIVMIFLSIVFRLAAVFRLTIPLLYALIVPTVFHEWYHSNQQLGDLIGYMLLAAVALLLLKKVVRHWTGITACTLILSGGIGNIIDRIVHGYVVDMFDLQLFSYPVFNLADCCVVVGAILGGIYYLFLYEKYDKKKKESDHAHDPSDPS